MADPKADPKVEENKVVRLQADMKARAEAVEKRLNIPSEVFSKIEGMALEGMVRCSVVATLVPVFEALGESLGEAKGGSDRRVVAKILEALMLTFE